MKKQNYSIVFIVLSSLFLSISIVPANPVPTDVTGFSRITSEPEWYDGMFQAKIQTTDQQLIGSINGTIELGRSDKTGSFTATWSTDQKTGTVQGRFSHHILFGLIKQNNQAIPFLGKIQGLVNTFSARCYSISSGTYLINGTYDTSFMYPLSGPYGIGIKEYHLIDSARPEYFTEENQEDKREMMMRIWYPTDAEENDLPSVDYMDAITFKWLKDRSPIPLITIPKDAYLFVDTHATHSPPLVIDDAPYPVIMFSHGYDGVYQIYTSLIEDLVSNGYIVASINHPYIAGVTVFSDDRVVYVSRIPLDETERQDWLVMGQRSVIEDIRYGLDVLTDMNNNDPMFKNIMDLSKVGVYGHSFGGGATIACCAKDPRFQAGLTLDGFFTAATITQGFSTPLCMMVTGGRYESDTSLPLVWDHLSHQAYLIGITGAEHYSFTDVGVLLDHLLPLIPAQVLGFGSINQKRMINITISLEKAFFDVYLRGKSPEIFIDLLSQYPEIQYMMKE